MFSIANINMESYFKADDQNSMNTLNMISIAQPILSNFNQKTHIDYSRVKSQVNAYACVYIHDNNNNNSVYHLIDFNKNGFIDNNWMFSLFN
jgi:hypothetical protein